MKYFVLHFLFIDILFAQTFCIESNNDFLNALDVAVHNKQDDYIKIIQGVTIKYKQLPIEIGYLINIKTDYSKDCKKQLLKILTKKNINVQNATKMISEDIINKYQSTSGPMPPIDYRKFETNLVRYSSGEESLIGIPSYLWRHGCGPTAVGMVAGYWDGKEGCQDIFDGDATNQTENVNQGIASGVTSNTPMHYEDYAIPTDQYPGLLMKDNSENPKESRHTNNSIADFMHTSWSKDKNYYGWSWSDFIIPSFVNYIKFKNNQYEAIGSVIYSNGDKIWNKLVDEINNKRPMVFLIDTDGDKRTDHFVAVTGYRIINNKKYYSMHDTWTRGLKWQEFGVMDYNFKWGVEAGYSFSVKCSIPKSKNLISGILYLLLD